MDNLEQTTSQEYQKNSKKVIREVIKYSRIFLLGAGVALKGAGWYLGYYEAGTHLLNQEYKRAAKYFTVSCAPSISGDVCIGISGLSFLPDLFIKRKKKKLEKELKSVNKKFQALTATSIFFIK